MGMAARAKAIKRNGPSKVAQELFYVYDDVIIRNKNE